MESSNQDNTENEIENEGQTEEFNPQAVDLAQKLLEVTDLLNHPATKIFTVTNKEGEDYLKDSMTRSIEHLLEKESVEEISHFIDKIAESKSFIAEVQGTPNIIENLYTLYRNQDIFTDPQKLLNFVYNVNLYQEERMDNSKEVKERIQHDPFATEEELDAGVYRESIESQVRDTVFILRKKGYNTFESGFGNRVRGEQFVGFDKSNFTEIPLIPEELSAELSSRNISIKIKESRDRYQLVLTPTRDFPSLQEWSDIWKIVAESMPTIENKSSQNIHTPIANSFVQKQEKMKKGEEVYLGYGFKFKGGSVAPKNT